MWNWWSYPLRWYLYYYSEFWVHFTTPRGSDQSENGWFVITSAVDVLCWSWWELLLLSRDLFSYLKNKRPVSEQLAGGVGWRLTPPGDQKNGSQANRNPCYNLMQQTQSYRNSHTHTELILISKRKQNKNFSVCFWMWKTLLRQILGSAGKGCVHNPSK